MDNSDSSAEEAWENELKIYKALSRAEIIYVTNYTIDFCDILFELHNEDENIIPLIFATLDKNNTTPGIEKSIYTLLSNRQIEIKNLWRRSYVRRFITRVYMSGMRKFIDNKNPEKRSLKLYCIDKDKNK